MKTYTPPKKGFFRGVDERTQRTAFYGATLFFYGGVCSIIISGINSNFGLFLAVMAMLVGACFLMVASKRAGKVQQ